MRVLRIQRHAHGMPLDAVSALTRLGGTADWAALMEVTTRGRLRTALAAGAVVRSQRGRYVLPDADLASRAAARMNGVLALRSAAMHHGWPVKFPPSVPEIGVPRKRHLSPPKASGWSGWTVSTPEPWSPRRCRP